MTGTDITKTVRIILGESNPSQRWSDQQLVPLVDRAQKLVVRRILWPTSIYTFNTSTNVQRYQTVEILETLQVYVAGQSIVRTDIETMEGDDIFFYDQTGTGGGPGGLIDFNQPPVIAVGNFTPQWTSQPPETYPVPSYIGTDVDSMCPWFPGHRPVYFFDGGVLGFVPAPAGVYPVVVRCVRQPATLAGLQNKLVLPDICFDAIMWKTVELMSFANAEKPAAPEQLNYALTEYEKAIKELRKWARGYDGGHNKGPNFLTYRNFYSRGNHRNWGFGQ